MKQVLLLFMLYIVAFNNVNYNRPIVTELPEVVEEIQTTQKIPSIIKEDKEKRDLNYNLSNILEILKIIESNNKEKIVGDNGKAYGILQIHNICIKEVNDTYNTQYVHKDAFNKECSEEIFYLIMKKGIKLYNKKYNKMPSEEDLVRMWNGGIYRGYKKESTKKYWDKYLKEKLN